ncbi:serine/threonine-protein kinase [Nocardioides mangrovi]|uniref:non-specific serine/threonine protein kinase n=1 Tax=Nocardioides mangrovi TaxID=2874580 RepID=A0ABS7UAX7_9ACTN|nr:serine/threonine-protein kinase [Nocardioides mangrovi]MBZ5738153.1 serine/threonine protein kinase [Nocardioides mangrovi]
MTEGTAVAGRYVLLDRVGTGGMGAVWRARDVRAAPGQDGVVAVKVLGGHDASMLLRFVREQSVRIRHPHVVAPTGWAAEDHQVVLAMDLVRGGSVADLLLETGALPASYAAVLLDQLLQALTAVHAAGVVHRDVKPANLLLEPGSPYLRLGDFGVAVAVDDIRLTRDRGVVGTDGYLAPEVLAGAPPEPRHDLYAVGVVASQLLTGRPPRPGVRPLVPEGPLRPWAEALTEPDPDLRPPSAAIALERLRRIEVPPDLPWPTVPDRVGDPPRPTGPRWPVVVSAASLVVIVGCLVAIGLMLT